MAEQAAAAGQRPDGGTTGGQAAALLRAPVSARTWLAVIHLLAGMVLGFVSFMVVVVGVVAGVSLLVVVLAGVPVLLATMWLCWQFARAERARFALLTGVRIAEPPSPALRPSGQRRRWWLLTSPAVWRSMVYALVRFPLGLAEGLLASIWWAAAVALLVSPAYYGLLPGGGAHIGGFWVRSPLAVTVAALAGLVLLLAAPPLTQALVAGDAAVTRWLIGPGSQAGLTARIGELETSRARVVDAGEAERRRIERDLHDGAQQRLVSLAMDLGRARARFADDPAAAERIVAEAHEQAKLALSELRSLVRGVHPPVLSDRGLDAALSGLAALSPVPVTVQASLPERCPAPVEAIAYFVVAEALTNIAKHARASHAEVTVTRHGGTLLVRVFDDGVGGADPRGQGLAGLADRVAGVDGRLSVISPPGGPTVIGVMLPCGS
jgi:signal transduction histidine kinase